LLVTPAYDGLLVVARNCEGVLSLKRADGEMLPASLSARFEHSEWPSDEPLEWNGVGYPESAYSWDFELEEVGSSYSVTTTSYVYRPVDTSNAWPAGLPKWVDKAFGVYEDTAGIELPEPSSSALQAASVLVLAAVARRRRRRL
jgi:hypothetical protein